MYSGSAIPAMAAGPDAIYIQRLQENIAGLNAEKMFSLNAEDYNTANNIKDKASYFLHKMEDQLSTDVLQNCITRWQNDLALFIQENLISASKKLSHSKPLSQPFHINFMKIVRGTPLSHYDSLVKAMLILLPHELPDTPKSPYGWDFLARKINGSLKNQDLIEVVRDMITLLVMDVVSLAIGRSNAERIRSETYDLTLQHVFHLLHTVAIRKINAELEGPLFDMSFTKCAITVGYICQFTSARDIFKFVMSYFDAAKKMAIEEIALALSILRYSFDPHIITSTSLDVMECLRDLLHQFDKTKKVIIKNALIQTMERVIQPIYGSQYKSPEETLIWDDIASVYKKARKWASADELKSSSLMLMTIIMVNSSIDFFAANIDSYINTDVCSKSKFRPYAYVCILQLFRGRYYQDTMRNYEDSENEVYITGRHFGSLTRSVNDQSFGTVSNRLLAIAEMMFFRKKLRIPIEYRDLAASIVIQISSHSIILGSKLIGQLLDTTRVDNSSDCYYVGLRALRVIVDPESGFQTFAASKNEVDFAVTIRDLPFDLTPRISAIYSFMESLIGVVASGTSGKVIEIPSDEDEEPKRNMEVITASVMVDVLSKAYEGTGLSLVEESSEGHDIFSTVGSMANLNILRRSKPDLPQAITTNRNSIMSVLSPLGISPSTGEPEKVDAEDDQVGDVIKQWFAAVGSPEKDCTKYWHSSVLIDRIRLRKRNTIKLKPEQREAVGLLQEILLMVRLTPTPEFIGGKYFIGSFLTHYREEISLDSYQTLVTVFRNYPEQRLVIINGFLTFMRNTTNRDDISTCTNILVFEKLIQIWSEEVAMKREGPIELDGFEKVSCKIDATMLLLMSHPINRIRTACLRILTQFYAIQMTFTSSKFSAREMTVAAILHASEEIIVKQAIFAFLKSGTSGHSLSSKVASSLNPLTFMQVAASNYSGLFRYYQAELAKRFSFFGRTKATRRLAKYLRLFVSPIVTQSLPNATSEYKALYTAYMNLLMSMAAIPLVSEVLYTRMPKRIEDSKELLITTFRSVIPSLLMRDQGWESKAFIRSLYFLHRDVAHLFITELMQNFQEIRHNASTVLSTRFLDNLFGMLRSMIQYPHFELLIQEDLIFSSELVLMYSDFMAFVSLSVYVDTTFLKDNNAARIKTAINYAIITHRLSECINTTSRKLTRQSRITGNAAPLVEFESVKWQTEQKKVAVSQMKEWYESIKEAALKPVGLLTLNTVDSPKITQLKRKLLLKIGFAMEQVMSLGDIYTESPLPGGLLRWLCVLEGEVFRVLTPDFLYTFDDAIGVALVSSYAGRGAYSPYTFSNSIFEQILPRLDDGPHMYLFGSSRRMSFAEPFIAATHALPPRSPSDLISPSFLFPDIKPEHRLKLRQNLGSSLFYGLYNLMSANQKVRIQSLAFVRELLIMFNPDKDNFNVAERLKVFNGAFYSGARIFIKDKIIALSATCSELFPADYGLLLLEAVRCANSVNLIGFNCLLVDPREWIFELIIPWCKFVTLSAISTDQSTSEFFKFLMDSAFHDQKLKDLTVNCWKEVASSPNFGTVNIVILMDVVIEITARFRLLHGSANLFASILTSIQPDIVSNILAFHLSSSAFPWNKKKVHESFQHTSHVAIREYVVSLYTHFKIAQAESENEYTLNCRGAAALASQIMPQNYDHFTQHMATLLTYILVSLSGSLKRSPVFELLQGCIHGFITFLHSSDSVNRQLHGQVQGNVKKFLGWLEMDDVQVTWILRARTKGAFQVADIPIDHFAEQLLTIFGTNNSSLRTEMLDELIKWIGEGFVSHEETVHAIKLFCLFLGLDQQIPPKYHNLFLPRLVDQLSVLSQLELEARGIKNVDKSVSPWSLLPRGKVKLRENSVEVIMAILVVHKTLLPNLVADGTIDSIGLVFWATYGLLNLSNNEFGDVVALAMDNLTFIFEKLDRSKIDSYFSFPLDPAKEQLSCDIQSTMIPHLFGGSSSLQDGAINILLSSWLTLPTDTVDKNRTATLYTVLYSSTWLFVRIYQSSMHSVTFKGILKKFQDFLDLKLPNALEELRLGLTIMNDSIERGMSDEAQNLLFSQCIGSIIKQFSFEYGNNISQYVSQILCLSSAYQQFGLKLALQLWQSNLADKSTSLNALRNMLRRVPFMKNGENISDVLIVQTFDLVDKEEIKESDLASQGRVEAMPELEISLGSVRQAFNWISTNLKVQPSNKLYYL